MEMDRQTLFVVAGAILAMALLSGYFFAPKSAARYDRPAYAQDDIRYKYQQADLKEKKKKKKKPAPAASSESSSDSGGSDNEEPAIEQDTQEEPPLD